MYIIILKDSLHQVHNITYYLHVTLTVMSYSGNVLEKVVEATGISRRTVVRIINEGRQIQTGEIDTFKSRETTIKRPSPKSTVDEFAEQVIRRTIYNFHITDKQKPTVQAILNKVRDDEGVNFTGQITSFRRLLKKLGFRYAS